MSCDSRLFRRLNTHCPQYSLNILTVTLGTLFFVFVMLFQRFDNVEIMTAFVAFKFVDWHGFSELLSVIALYIAWYFSC